MQRSPSGLSRRDLLATLAAGATLLRPDYLNAAEPDPRLAQVLARTISIDLHSHVGIPFGKPNAPLPSFDLVGEMKRTGFSAVIQTYEVDSVPAAPGEDYTHNLEALNFEDRLLAAAHVPRALTLKDLETGHAQGRPRIIQSAEGAQFLEGRIERVEEVYKRGVRNLQLVHERDDKVKPLGDIYTKPARLGGLTDFGAEVIRACNRLGIVVDLTHMSYDGVKSALKISTQPVIFSHTGPLPGPGEPNKIPNMAPRLLSKEEMRDIAGAGGIIGVWNHGSDTAKEYVEMIGRVVDTTGVDHVGIGTDSDLEPNVQRTYTNAIWKGETRGFFPAVAEEMLRAGFTPEETGKIGGGNFCRIFSKITAVNARS
ncbi:MAG TPA: membrane dipeptidase [Bryobacteraceae bacterium]|nr:membrane dipeptidase [Bryobacteraceae bacterium]